MKLKEKLITAVITSLVITIILVNHFIIDIGKVTYPVLSLIPLTLVVAFIGTFIYGITISIGLDYILKKLGSIVGAISFTILHALFAFIAIYAVDHFFAKGFGYYAGGSVMLFAILDIIIRTIKLNALLKNLVKK